MFVGNGGSAADAQHMSAEYVSRFMFDRPGLSSIALTTDTSALTAIGNDYGFEKLFSRQIQAIGKVVIYFLLILPLALLKILFMQLKRQKEKKSFQSL